MPARCAPGPAILAWRCCGWSSWPRPSEPLLAGEAVLTPAPPRWLPLSVAGLSLSPARPWSARSQRNGDTVPSAVMRGRIVRRAGRHPAGRTPRAASARATLAPVGRAARARSGATKAAWRSTASSAASIPCPVVGRDQQHRRLPLPCRRHQPKRTFEVALGALGDAAEIGLGDQGDVGDLDDAGLHELQAVAGAGLDREHHRVGELGDLGLRLADAHGLDQDDVVERAHQHGGGGAQVGEAAQPVARGHRADEHAGIVGVDVDPGAVAEQRTAGAARGRVDRDHGHGPAALAPGADEGRDQGRLADARRAGEPDHGGARLGPGGIEECQRGLVGRVRPRPAPAPAPVLPCRPARSSSSGSLNGPAWPAAPPGPRPGARSARGRASRRRSRGRPARRTRPRPDRRHARRRCRA